MGARSGSVCGGPTHPLTLEATENAPGRQRLPSFTMGRQFRPAELAVAPLRAALAFAIVLQRSPDPQIRDILHFADTPYWLHSMLTQVASVGVQG